MHAVLPGLRCCYSGFLFGGNNWKTNSTCDLEKGLHAKTWVHETACLARVPRYTFGNSVSLLAYPVVAVPYFCFRFFLHLLCLHFEVFGCHCLFFYFGFILVLLSSHLTKPFPVICCFLLFMSAFCVCVHVFIFGLVPFWEGLGWGGPKAPHLT